MKSSSEQLGMGFICLIASFALFHHVLSYSPQQIENFYKHCPLIDCGKLGQIRIPFTNKTIPEICGPFLVKGCDIDVQEIQLEKGKGRWYEIENISQSNTIFITDTEFQNQLENKQCQSFNNLSFPIREYAPFRITHNITLFKCNYDNSNPYPDFDFKYTGCENFIIYYNYMNSTLPKLPPDCSIIQLPLKMNQSYDDIFQMLTAKFSLEIFWWTECYQCQVLYKGKCQRNVKDSIICVDANGKRIRGHEEKAKQDTGLAWRLILGIGSFAAAVIIMHIFIRRRRKRMDTSSNIVSANSYSSRTSKSEMGGDNVCFAVPIFSYAELKDATSNFDPEKELGNGGFGAVYYGKLRDGRGVAIKRLYEHDYRRVQQFTNEIEILSQLRHKNLVSLYGCTSRKSRELLIVYEYIPNGTVADHLHGDLANSSPLTWPLRLKIAIETASALAYLHTSDVIHRDVKTTNILLDSNYNVKVADFGISRLFPSDATHISTAPQGTLGYVDPEYHQSYQLTNKSDVYSFGVVLIELISSLPAVDITRKGNEINLANLAIKRMQKCEFEELIDPCLGYWSNKEVKRMVTSVAALAYRCLQQDKEIRPSMDEVLKELQTTESGDYELEHLTEGNDNDQVLTSKPKSMELQPSQPGCDDIALLKNIPPQPSPNSVTHKWISCSSTATKSSFLLFFFP